MGNPDALQNEESKDLTYRTIPQWVRELFSQIWDPELIISGIAIYGLFQVPDKLNDLQLYLQNKIPFIGLILLMKILILSNYSLIFGFIIHLILRGYWVGIVGLNSVFIDGINYKNLKYTPSFISRLQKKYGNLHEYSIKVDNLCSQIFSFAFLILLSIISFSICILIPIILFGDILIDIFKINEKIFVPFLFIYLGLASLYTFDFITLGLLKRNKIIYKIYFPIYWFFSIISLAILYRPIYYTFISNYSKLRFSLILTIYIIGTFLIGFGLVMINKTNFAYDNLSDYSNYTAFKSNNYENLQNENMRIGIAIINQDMFSKGDYIRLFIPLNALDYKKLKDKISKINIYRSAKKDSMVLNLLKTLYQIKINDSILLDSTKSKLNFRYAKYGAKDEWGIITYISTQNLKFGENVLNVSIPSEYWVDKGQKTYLQVGIPFWVK